MMSNETLLSKSEHFRRRAAWYRQQANGASDTEVRDVFATTANEYDVLALEAEERDLRLMTAPGVG